MFKIFYKYGTMKSSKTAELLMNAHNYEDKDVSVFLIMSSRKSRDFSHGMDRLP